MRRMRSRANAILRRAGGAVLALLAVCAICAIMAFIPASSKVDYAGGLCENCSSVPSAAISPASFVLDAYLQLLDYRAQSGTLANAKDTYVRILVETRPGCVPNDRIPVVSSVGDIYTSYCHVGRLREIAQLPGIKRIEIGSSPLQAHADGPGVSKPLEQDGLPNNEGMQADGEGVIIGVIDSGVALGNADFFDPAAKDAKTIFVWDQQDPTGQSPRLEGQGYGTEYGRDQIVQGIVNDAFYTKDLDGHGTAVASVCGGRWGLAPQAELIVVTSSHSKAEIVDGVNYIFKRSAQLGRPCVINLSYGTEAGRHDGTSLFERALEALTGNGRIIVCGAGNQQPENTCAARMHRRRAEIRMEFGHERTSSSRNERPVAPMLVVCGRFDELELLDSPAGKRLLLLQPGQAGECGLGGYGTLFFAWEVSRNRGGTQQLVLQWHGISPGSVTCFTLQARDTQYDPGQADEGTIHAWICDADGTARFHNCETQDPVPVCLPGSAKDLVSVGSIGADGRPAAFTPLPLRINGVYKPDVYAPGTDIIVSVPYTLAPAPRRRTARISGTSISAAIVTGYVARILQEQPTLDPNAIKSILVTRDPLVPTENILRFTRRQQLQCLDVYSSDLRLPGYHQSVLPCDSAAGMTDP